MGIKGLKTFFKNFYGKGIERVHLSKYKGKCVAIDISLLLYRFNLRKNSKYESYLLELSSFIDKWVLYGVNLIFIFDGKPNSEKQKTIEYRKSYKYAQEHIIDDLSQQLETCESLSTYLEIKLQIDKRQKKTFNISTDQIQKCKVLFDSLGICYIHIESMETEAIFPFLFANNIIQACYTSDTDAHPYGCNIILSELNWDNISTESNTVQEDNHYEILKHLNMTHHEFVILCSVSINDYCKTLKYCNIEELFKLYKKYHSIEAIKNNLPDINLDRDKHIELPDKLQYDKIYDIFTKELSIKVIDDINKSLSLFAQKQKINKPNIIQVVKTVLDNFKNITTTKSLYNFYSIKIKRICKYTYDIDIFI